MNQPEHRASPDSADFDLAAQEIAPAPAEAAGKKPARKSAAKRVPASWC